MARTERIPVWAIDGKSILVCVDEDRAAEMRLEKFDLTDDFRYDYGFEMKYGKKREWLQLRPTPKTRDSNSFSPCSLTLGDTLGNVGLTSQVIHAAGQEQEYGITAHRQSEIQVRVAAHNPRFGRTVTCAST